jgi:hypothetical protein
LKRPATISLEDFPIGSVESRAAARRLLAGRASRSGPKFVVVMPDEPEPDLRMLPPDCFVVRIGNVE